MSLMVHRALANRPGGVSRGQLRFCREITAAPSMACLGMRVDHHVQSAMKHASIHPAICCQYIWLALLCLLAMCCRHVLVNLLERMQGTKLECCCSDQQQRSGLHGAQETGVYLIK